MDANMQSLAKIKQECTLESVAGALYFMIFSAYREISVNNSKLSYVPSTMLGPQQRTGV